MAAKSITGPARGDLVFQPGWAAFNFRHDVITRGSCLRAGQIKSAPRTLTVSKLNQVLEAFAGMHLSGLPAHTVQATWRSARKPRGV